MENKSQGENHLLGILMIACEILFMVGVWVWPRHDPIGGAYCNTPLIPIFGGIYVAAV